MLTFHLYTADTFTQLKTVSNLLCEIAFKQHACSLFLPYDSFFFFPLCKTKLSEFKLQILTQSDMTVKLNTNQLSCFLLYVSFFTPYRYKLALVCDQSTIFGKSLQLLVNSSAIMLSVLQLCSWNDFSICKTFGSKLSADGSQPPDSSPTFMDGLT